jgi:DNA-binding PucR family transcriptional regulator
MYTHSGSSFNRVETETSDIKQRKITISLYDIDLIDSQVEDKIDLSSIIKRAELKDTERMYLNAYIDNGMSYTRCSKELDIHPRTISKHVKKAIEKCKNSL